MQNQPNCFVDKLAPNLQEPKRVNGQSGSGEVPLARFQVLGNGGESVFV